MEENYFDVKFDEEPLTGDEWLHMMQQEALIDMLLFGERVTLVFGNQVEYNMFAVAKVCEETNKAEEEEEEKKALIVQHNKYISNIDLGCEKYNDPMTKVKRKRWMFLKTKMKALKQFFSNGVKKR